MTASVIIIQGGNPPGAVVTGSGFISGNGYDSTPGIWGFSTQDTSASNPPRFSLSASSNTEPCTGSIGDFVWEDLNGNGIQDAGEPGINGVIVRLKDSTGTIVLQTATTANLGLMPGYYLFTGLCANTYMVEVDDSAWPPLAGLTPTLTYQGGDPARTAIRTRRPSRCRRTIRRI